MQAQRGSSGDGNAHRNVIEEEKKNQMNKESSNEIIARGSKQGVGAVQ